MSFETLGLSAELLRAICEQGYTEPTPVQQQAIPAILKRQDVMVTSQTGTGKTAGFTLPMLQLLMANSSPKRSVRALILTPTRELAVQVFENIRAYGKYLPLRSAVVYGGVNISPQIAQLKRGVDILVATPGRLLDLVNQKFANLSSIEFFVLDEADRMLDMGFIPDIRKILQLMPPRRQNLLFSATFSPEIKTLADKLLSAPILIEIARRNTLSKQITHLVHPVDRHRKRELLSFIIGSKNWRQVLVFTKTKHGANKLADQLENDGLPSAAIHGNKSQGARTRALTAFKQGKVRVLVATDVAARGLDIDKLPHVVNYDLPQVAKDYVHRVGRTGRASHEGMAVSLVSEDERSLLRDIEKLLQSPVPQEIIPGYAPSPSAKAPSGEKFSPRRRNNFRRPSRGKRRH